MSFAGPIDTVPERELPPSTKRRGITRRHVLGAAIAGGAGVAAARLLGVGSGALPKAGTRADWISPLGSEQARVSHLLRRATFGATLDELESANSAGYTKTVNRLVETEPSVPAPLAGIEDVTRGTRINLPDLQLWWVNQMLTSPTPFAERMTLFWHGHFTSDYRKVGTQFPFIYWQNLTWRRMALTDLRSMLMKVTVDPAMLAYLDLRTSTGASPNENYSRELMELFTLGAGNFNENDVRALAKALAGWTQPQPASFASVVVDPKNNVTQKYPVYGQQTDGKFDPRRAYGYPKLGPITLLGKTGSFDTQQALDLILAQKATAPHVTSKVVQHFVGPRTEPSYVNRLADRFRSSRYDLKQLMRDVFMSPEFTADSSYRSLVKSPLEFMVNTLKALNAPQGARQVVAMGSGMGQVLFDPPDVGGWPNNDGWISSNTVVARVNFISGLVGQIKSLPPSADAYRQHLDAVLSPQTATLLNQARDEKTRWLLLLASPEFQLK